MIWLLSFSETKYKKRVAMDPLTISLISFVFILGGMLLGFFISKRLPEHHLTSDSKDGVKMTWGIIATMTALVLGLLVASAKNTFDTVNNERTEAAAKLIILNHLLIRYGPDADGLRQDLRRDVASGIKRDWPDEKFDVDVPPAPENSNLIDAFQDKLDHLTPTTDLQRGILAQAQKICGELALGRWLVIEQTTIQLPNVLLITVVFWLSLLFMGLGLIAPRNKTTLISSALGVFSVSLAIYIINDMSHPLQGLITVSSTSMHDVWARLNP